MYKIKIDYEMDFDNAVQRDGVFKGLGNVLSKISPTATAKIGSIAKWDEVEVQIPQVRRERQNRVRHKVGE